ncbi:MAG: hypothetical protein J6U10_05635 [Lachnospiraceae bacterium]|nr:hypothetical protein [Lachnospiraceae bacterium]
MTKMQKGILVGFIAALTAILGLLTVILPKKDYSENENRYLEEFPEFSFENIKDGSFMSDVETYVSDHFAFRDVFMTVKTYYERATGRNRINDIYMCGDGYYIEEYKPLENADRIAGAISRLAAAAKEQGSEFVAVLVPTAVSVESYRLPATAKNASQAEDIEKIKALVKAGETAGDSLFLDVTDALVRAGDRDQVFYKLDHHWTTAGAFAAYTELCKRLGLEPLERSAFKEETVSTDFRGSFYSKVNDLLAKPDDIVAFKSDRLKLTVSYPDKKVETDTLYAEEYLEKKDKYSYFLNNQNSFVEITNANASTDRTLAIVKDSYANCLVPFLCEHYAKVYVFDTRYYREKVSDFIKNEKVTDVIFLYNMYTIDKDTGIKGIE